MEKHRQKRSQQFAKLIDGNLQVIDDAAKCLGLQIARMHGNHYSSLVLGPNVNRVATPLPSELETEAFSHTRDFFRGCDGKLRRHTGISIGLISMSSVGIGRPSSSKDSM